MRNTDWAHNVRRYAGGECWAGRERAPKPVQYCPGSPYEVDSRLRSCYHRIVAFCSIDSASLV